MHRQHSARRYGLLDGKSATTNKQDFLAAIAKLHGKTIAARIAIGSEYTWHDNPNWDPVADAAGLVG